MAAAETEHTGSRLAAQHSPSVAFPMPAGGTANCRHALGEAGGGGGGVGSGSSAGSVSSQLLHLSRWDPGHPDPDLRRRTGELVGKRNTARLHLWIFTREFLHSLATYSFCSL